MSSLSALPKTPPPRPYRRLLTSALHKRFVNAAALSLVVGLNNAFWIGSKKDILWSWFPLGPAGIKALLFSMSSLFIFVLQIATLGVGKRTTTSPFTTLTLLCFNGTALQTLFWYLVAGWWFTEAYVWSSPSLGWISKGSHTTPDVLNERPIFFRAYAIMLSLIYAGFHLGYGSVSVHIPVSATPSKPADEAKTQDTHKMASIPAQLQQKSLPILLQSAGISGVAIVAAPFIYGLILRNILWQLHLVLAKPFFNLSSSNASPIGYPPLGPTYLVHCFLAGFLMIATFEITTALFHTYLKQEPTKAGLPLSTTSKDPNGTLLDGLKAKRAVVRTFAFWELAIIAQRHKDRRKAIFEDIDRPAGPMWAQMVQAGLAVLQEVQLRITGPPPKPQTSGADNVKPLPRLVPESQTQSIMNPNLKSTRADWVASPLKHFGSTQQPWRPPIDETTKQIEAKLTQIAAPPGADPNSSQGLFTQWMTVLKQSRVGWFFVSTNASRINAAVLGSPYGNAAIIVDVIEAITKMQIASLGEDTYGKATPTVPDTVKTFTKTLSLIEDLVAKNKSDGDIREVEIVVQRLRNALMELLSAFQVYLLDQGLGIADLNQAKKAVEAPKQESSQQKPQPKPNRIDQSSGPRRKLFPQLDSGGRGQANERRPSAGKEPQRIEQLPSWSRNNANGPLFRRREMEQVG